MPTVTYSNPSICAGGDHLSVDVALNGSAILSPRYDVDRVRTPLAELTDNERDTLALLILKLHFAGKTRAQIKTEFQAGPVTVTI